MMSKVTTSIIEMEDRTNFNKVADQIDYELKNHFFRFKEWRKQILISANNDKRAIFMHMLLEF